PIVFSSATLSVHGSFQLMMDTLGIEDSLSFTVASPYDYEQQMSLTIPEHGDPPNIQAKLKHTYQMLEKSRGRTLLLFPSMEQLEQFRIASDQLAESGSYRILY